MYEELYLNAANLDLYNDWFHPAPTKFKKFRKGNNHQPKRKKRK